MTYLGLTHRLPAALFTLLLAACDGKDGVLTSHVQDTDTSTSSDESTAAQPTTGDDPTPELTTTTTTGPSELTTDGSTADGSTTDDSDDTDTTTESQPLCECVADEPGGLWVDPTPPTCVETLCPQVDAHYETFCDDECLDDGTVDVAALECALTALRDRTPGLLRWRLVVDELEVYIDSGYVWILDDGTTIWRKWVEEDLLFTVEAAQIVELPPSAAYEQCLTQPDKLRFECLRQSLSSPDNFVCDEGWAAEGI